MMKKTFLMILLAFLGVNVNSTAHISEKHKSRELVGFEVIPLGNVLLRLKTLFKLKIYATNNLRFSSAIERPTSKILCGAFPFGIKKIFIPFVLERVVPCEIEELADPTLIC